MGGKLPFARKFCGRVKSIIRADKKAENTFPKKHFFMERLRGAKKDKDCIPTERPLKDKRKAAITNPVLVLGKDKIPPVTSIRPEAKENSGDFPKRSDKSEDKMLKIIKFPTIIPMVKRESFKDAENTEGKLLRSGVTGELFLSAACNSPFVKRPITMDGKI